MGRILCEPKPRWEDEEVSLEEVVSALGSALKPIGATVLKVVGKTAFIILSVKSSKIIVLYALASTGIAFPTFVLLGASAVTSLTVCYLGGQL